MAILSPTTYNITLGTLIIESAKLTDAAALIELTKTIDSETEFLMRDSGEFKIDMKNEEILINSKRNSESELLLVARVNDKLVGTLRFSSNRYNRYKHKGQYVLSVLKDYWNQGIGTRMIEVMLAWADDYGFLKIKLEVDANNIRAIGLYKKMGFEEEGILRMDKYIGNGTYIDSIAMGRLHYPKSK